MVFLLALLIGVVTGMRAMMAPAAIAWAAYGGWIDLSGSWLGFFGARWTSWIFAVLALAELVTDQLPATPSRKVPQQFGTRILFGGLCGAAIGVAAGSAWIGGVLGIVGAVIGTLGGAAARGRLAVMFGKDRPAALIEDAVAIGGAALIVGML